MSAVTLLPTDNEREVDLVHAEGTMCRLRMSALNLPPDSVYFPDGLRLTLLTVGPHFDGLARAWFVEHATEAGWDQDRIEMSCFLARLYRMVILKQRVLRQHDILGHGWWGRAATAEVTAGMEGTAWDRVIALHRETVDDEAVMPEADALRHQYDELLIWRSPWLEPLSRPPDGKLDEKDLALAEHLRNWDARVRVEMEHDFLETEKLSPDDLDSFDDKTITKKYLRSLTEYTSKLKEHLHDVRRGRIAGDIGTPERLARVLWQGRVEFLWRWDRAAEAVHGALMKCDDVSRHEADLFAMLHVNFWPMADTVVRVDEVVREFLLFGEEGQWLAFRAAIAAFVLSDNDARDQLHRLFGAYITVLQTHTELQRAKDREAKTKLPTVKTEILERVSASPPPPEVAPLSKSADIDWEEIADLPIVQEALSELSSDKRRLIVEARMAGLTRGEAADVSEASRATVTKAEQQMKQILREHLER